MFDNISKKIKILAEVLCWIGIIASIIYGIILLKDGLILRGILTAIVYSLLSWIGSFVLYGFGQLVENSDTIVCQNRKLVNSKDNQDNKVFYHHDILQTNSPGSNDKSHKWRCDFCGKMISESPCPYCEKEAQEKQELAEIAEHERLQKEQELIEIAKEERKKERRRIVATVIFIAIILSLIVGGLIVYTSSPTNPTISFI